MKKISQLALLIILPFLFSGCALYKDRINGTKTSSEMMQEFVDNKSTQKDIVNALGYPSKKVQLGNKEVWYYQYSKIPVFSSNTFESTVFEFNNRKILITHYQTPGQPSLGAYY